ncbi:hypothetical protein P8452_37842 [Trifolium repens]|nr:hypothetical protein P8452_37842 [Trifolium repens]
MAVTFLDLISITIKSQSGVLPLVVNMQLLLMLEVEIMMSLASVHIAFVGIALRRLIVQWTVALCFCWNCTEAHRSVDCGKVDYEKQCRIRFHLHLGEATLLRKLHSLPHRLCRSRTVEATHLPGSGRHYFFILVSDYCSQTPRAGHGQAILGYLIINFMVAVASHRGNLQLAAANLGSSGIQLFPYGLKKVEKLSATLHSIDNKPLNSHVYFADDSCDDDEQAKRFSIVTEMVIREQTVQKGGEEEEQVQKGAMGLVQKE